MTIRRVPDVSGRRRRSTWIPVVAIVLAATACAGSDEQDGLPAATTTPVGAACSIIPGQGEGSIDDIADDPAAAALAKLSELSMFTELVEAAGLVDTINGKGPITVFAPTDAAFEALTQGELATFADDHDLLADVLTYHVITGRSLTSDEMAAIDQLETANGASVRFGSTGRRVNDSSVVCANIETANATVHLIDAVLRPD